MGQVISFGIWGVGRMGWIHSECFAARPEQYRPAAFCDVDMERARASR